MRLVVARQAECDLDQIQEFHERTRRPFERFLAEIDAAFQHLLDWPESGHQGLDLLASLLIVVGVMHASRDLADILGHLQ